MGRNYKIATGGQARPKPKEPLVFLKAPTAVIGPGQAIVLPPTVGPVMAEGELAVVIGREARRVSEAKVLDYVLGYSCANDVTARDLLRVDGQWARAKSFETFCPIGPCIQTEADPSDLELRTSVNGEQKQRCSTKELLFTVQEMIAFISYVMPLMPGDVISTGTPPGPPIISPGDEVTITIENIGHLTNKVVLGT
jgi:2-keto-4-pentenoate hydratase/2-oxohepta-3-ene-1,7-dioic acid hydratase in catechol pathway